MNNTQEFNIPQSPNDKPREIIKVKISDFLEFYGDRLHRALCIQFMVFIGNKIDLSVAIINLKGQPRGDNPMHTWLMDYYKPEHKAKHFQEYLKSAYIYSYAKHSTAVKNKVGTSYLASIDDTGSKHREDFINSYLIPLTQSPKTDIVELEVWDIAQLDLQN